MQRVIEILKESIDVNFNEQPIDGTVVADHSPLIEKYNKVSRPFLELSQYLEMRRRVQKELSK